MEELKKTDLLMDGEVAIQPEGSDQPFIYRGFRMVDEEKLRELRGDELRKMNQNGMLPIIYAHLFSLSQMREVFGRQIQQGSAPDAGSSAGSRDGLRPHSAAVAKRRPRRASPKLDGERLDQCRGDIEIAARALERRVEIAAPVELDLQRMDVARRTCMTLDDMAARERVVQPGLESAPVGDAHRFAC